MALVLGVNSYATLAEAELYFEDRIDVAAWDAADDDMKTKALVTSTRFLEGKSYAGYATKSTQNLAFPRTGFFQDDSLGRSIEFNKGYVWAETAVDEDFATWLSSFKSLPLEIQLLKKGCFEQAYHAINNDGLHDTVVGRGSPDEIRIGSLELRGLHGTTFTTGSTTSGLTRDFIRPLLVNGGATLWFRAN